MLPSNSFANKLPPALREAVAARLLQGSLDTSKGSIVAQLPDGSVRQCRTEAEAELQFEAFEQTQGATQ